MYYNRKTKTIENPEESGQKTLELLYNSLGGRVFLQTIAARPWFSDLLANYHKSTWSHKDIVPFIQKHDIKVCPNCANKHYKTFNDFFIRKKKVNVDLTKNVLVSPADSKMRFFQISDDLRIKIKGTTYSIADILGSEVDAQAFKNGTCIVFRLSVDDYHRYHYIDNGKQVYHRKIKGQLHTVRPISEKYKVYSRNAREVTIMETENFGMVGQVEVGALMVGKIINHEQLVFKKYEEKGYFEFGGSTIVLFLQDKIKFDEDIEKAVADGYEVKVSAGERIGICLKD